MEKVDFFVRKGETKDIEVEGLVFKMKKVTADDELNWIEEYKEKVVEKDSKGNDRIVVKENFAKLAKCKLRNIIEVPFTREELKEISGLDKEYREYSEQEKDALFGQLNPRMMSKMISLIDESRSNQKKS